MRTTGFYRYLFTANLFTRNDDGTYNAAGTVNVNVVGNKVAGVLDVFSEAPLPDKARLSDIRDRGGTLIYPTSESSEGLTYQVQISQPVVGPFGYREFFVNRVRPI